MNKNYQNVEEWSGDVIGHVLTGGNLQGYRNISFLFRKAYAASTLILMRHRFGVNFVTWGTLIWVWLVLGLFRLISDPGSSILIAIHFVAVMIVGVFRIRESRKNLRNLDRGDARHSMDWGSSLLIPYFAKLVNKLKLDDHPFIRSMNEFYFQKWIEPAFLVLIGVISIMIQCYVFAVLMITSATCIFWMARKIERDYYATVQKAIDAGENAEIMRSTQEVPRTPNRVVTRVERRP